MSRRQERILVCGTNGTGKSRFADAIIQAYPKEKVSLIIDPDGSEELFDKYTEITEDLIPYQNQWGTNRAKCMYTSAKIFDTILTPPREKFNGLLVLDDARNYSGSRDEHLLRLFRRSRQKNMDILFICHGLSEIPPSLITFSTKLVLFNTVDSWQRLKQNITNPEKFEQYVNYVRKKASQHTKECDITKGKSNICSFHNCGAAYFKKVIDLKKDIV